MRNNQIVHGDQTRREERFLGAMHLYA